MTMHWPNCVFCFLLAVTMVNVQNAATYFLQKPKFDSLQARRLIAKALINNVHLRTGMTPQKHPKMPFHRACPYHGPTLPKNCSRLTHQLQDEICQVDMYRLRSYCEVVLSVYTRTDVLHRLLW